MWAQGKINIKRGEIMISKEEKEVTKVLEELVTDHFAVIGFREDVIKEKATSVHKIYKPLLEKKDKSIEDLNMECRAREIDNHDLKAENNRLDNLRTRYLDE